MRLGRRITQVVGGLLVTNILMLAVSVHLLLATHRPLAAWTMAGILGGLLIALAFVAVSTIRRCVSALDGLADEADRAAREVLPAAVEEIRAMDSVVTAPSVPALKTPAVVEFSRLVGSMNRLQECAVRLAVDSRRSQLGHSQVLVNMGRRNQSMLNRSLAFVSELEERESDPQVLATLFKLDHLTTRIRRNAESTLVLAGAEQSRPHSRPVVMENVLRAALAEIEDHHRVEVQDMAPVSVVGHAAADLSHLLAELLENAAAFSPSTEDVVVTGEAQGEEYELRIADAGLGMPAPDLERANQLLGGSSPQDLDTRRLGHLIVSRIAGRRGMRVHLESRRPGGITARVVIPAALIHGFTRDTGTPAFGMPQVRASEVHAGRILPQGRTANDAVALAPAAAGTAGKQTSGRTSPAPTRRVRGAGLAQLDLNEGAVYVESPTDANAVQHALSGLQRGSRTARGELIQEGPPASQSQPGASE